MWNDLKNSSSPATDFLPSVVEREALKQRLVRIAQQTNTQVILFCGEKGSGRHFLSRAFAQTLLCEEQPDTGACHQCHACRCFLSGTHPDYIHLSRGEERTIKAERLREQVVGTLRMKPQFGSLKIYLIDGDDLNETGQNILLKSLEEPPAYARFFLTVERMDTLLPTLLSRSVLLKMPPLSPEGLQQVLAKSGYPKPNPFWIHFAGGNPGKAIHLATDESFQSLREEAMSRFWRAPGQSYFQLLSQEQPLLMGDKERFPLVLDLSESLVRDLVALLSGCSEVINLDKLDRIQTLCRQTSLPQLATFQDSLKELRRAQEANVNHETLCGQYLLRLRQAFREKE